MNVPPKQNTPNYELATLDYGVSKKTSTMIHYSEAFRNEYTIETDGIDPICKGVFSNDYVTFLEDKLNEARNKLIEAQRELDEKSTWLQKAKEEIQGKKISVYEIEAIAHYDDSPQHATIAVQAYFEDVAEYKDVLDKLPKAFSLEGFDIKSIKKLANHAEVML